MGAGRFRRWRAYGGKVSLVAPNDNPVLGYRRMHDDHKSVTTTFALKPDVTVSPRKTRMLVVARGGIEPPTRRFSGMMPNETLAEDHAGHAQCQLPRKCF